MTLNVRMDINGTVFGEVKITRPEDTYETPAEQEIAYSYDYDGPYGKIWDGKITHRPVEGAMALATKTLNQIYDNRIRP